MTLLFSGVAMAGLQYQNYVVRQDSGMDVLCDPYIVKQDDWVYKIFRQKGELSSRDFPEFLAIFKRINPKVHDINTIRPGMQILIPLKKLPPDSLPGQATGLVSIPFVTVSKVSALLADYTATYTVKQGDTVYGLINRRFAPLGSESFARGLTLLKEMNPTLKSLDRIYTGQTLALPDPAITRQAWYGNLFDPDGNIRNEIDLAGSPPPETVNIAQQPLDPTPAPPPESDFERVARLLNARLLTKGTFYFPNPAGMDFGLDLARFPVMQLKNGRRIIFQTTETLAKADQTRIKAFWPDLTLVAVKPDAPMTQLLASGLKSQPGVPGGNQLSFSDQGIHVTVRANWITDIPVQPPDTANHICITLIGDAAERTPAAILRYLADHRIICKEIVYPPANQPPPAANQRHYPIADPKPPILIETLDPKAFVRKTLAALEVHFTPGVTIRFPYAGLQVEAQTNLASLPDGRSLLVDFGDLQGGAIAAIQKTGLATVQIDMRDDFTTILNSLLVSLAIDFKTDPMFLSAPRPETFNTALTIPGFLVHQDNRKLFCAVPLDEQIVAFLERRNIAVVRYEALQQMQLMTRSIQTAIDPYI